jgi:hypothetical protein
VIYPGSTPVGNATLVVANVLTCNKYSQKIRTKRDHSTAAVCRGLNACLKECRCSSTNACCRKGNKNDTLGPSDLGPHQNTGGKKILRNSQPQDAKSCLHRPKSVGVCLCLCVLLQRCRWVTS